MVATIEEDALTGDAKGFARPKSRSLTPRLGNHDIVGFEIAMDNGAAMGFIERVGDLRAIFQNLVVRERSTPQSGAESFAFEALEDEVVRALVGSDVVQNTDVG